MFDKRIDLLKRKVEMYHDNAEYWENRSNTLEILLMNTIKKYNHLENLYNQALEDYDEQLRINGEHRKLNGELRKELKK